MSIGTGPLCDRIRGQGLCYSQKLRAEARSYALVPHSRPIAERVNVIAGHPGGTEPECAGQGNLGPPTLGPARFSNGVFPATLLVDAALVVGGVEFETGEIR